MDDVAVQQLSADVLQVMGLPPEGVDYILTAATSPPSHKVGRRRRRNLIFEVPLKSLPGVVVQAESLTGEFNFLAELDRRRDLLGVFDQPTTVKLGITDRLGRVTRTTYTADYLVVDNQKVTAFEIKADSELEKLIRDRPTDWSHDEDGYHYRPAGAHFRSLGIEHVVVPISSLNAVRADNLRLLSSARRAPDSKKYRRVRHGLRQLFTHEPTIRMTEVLDRLEDGDATPILQLLDSEEIFADLDRVTLSDPESVWLSTSLDLVKVIQEASNTLATLFRSHDLNSAELIDGRYEAEVAHRLAIVQGITRTSRKGKQVSQSTIQRYRRAFNVSGGDPRSLVPGWRRCGNRESLIGAVHLAFLEGCIRAGKRDKTDPTTNSSFNSYVSAFPAAKIALGMFDDRPVCRATFYTHWDQISLNNEDSFEKGGRRLENEQADSFDPKTKTILATRPFAVAHIDHWKTDLHLVVGCVNGVTITKRPWLTAMVDAFSGEILAIWLSFADPSKKSCTMVIRDCARRHGRLPEMIITDAGSDFRSVHFFVMLATLKVIRCERPPEDPRFGIEVERLFKDFKDRFARGLPGFGISIERARAVSAAFKAAKGASLTLLEAFEAIEAFSFRGYNSSPKPSETSSRLALREKGDKIFPHNGREIVWDLKFLITTSIEAPDSDYKLWTGRGIHVYDKWYSSPRLLEYRGYKKDITVRLEPYADSVIYVCIEGKWLECRNSDASFQFAMSDQSLIFQSSKRQDLSALRNELSNDMNRYVAGVVSDKLEEISKLRASAATEVAAPKPADPQTSVLPEVSRSSFDDIVPYENELP